MLRKIAFKNARRNSGDYVVYAITMIFAIAILYSFSAVFPQAIALVDKKIAETNYTSLQTLNVCLIICSVLIGLAFVFLIIYANGFFLKQRKKELGLYLLLGLDKKQVSCILILESSLATFVSFILGLVLGIGVSQLLGLFTSTLFYGDISAYKFYISFEALGYSAVFFFVLLALTLIADIISIGKCSLSNLFTSNAVTEGKNISKHYKTKIAVFVISIILLLACYALMVLAFIQTSYIVFIVGSIAAFMFYFSFSALLFNGINKNKKFLFHKNNLFVMKQYFASVNSSSTSLAFTSLILIMTVFLMSLGFGLQYGYQGTDNWFGFSYLGIYMGVSFMLIACAIVSIRELSNITNNKKRYDCLMKLGMDSSMIQSTLLKEEILYFGLPVIFSGIAIAIGLIGAKSNALQYLNTDINKGIGIALAIAIGVYFTYFLFTYILSYKTITKEYRQND